MEPKAQRQRLQPSRSRAYKTERSLRKRTNQSSTRHLIEEHYADSKKDDHLGESSAGLRHILGAIGKKGSITQCNDDAAGQPLHVMLAPGLIWGFWNCYDSTIFFIMKGNAVHVSAPNKHDQHSTEDAFSVRKVVFLLNHLM